MLNYNPKTTSALLIGVSNFGKGYSKISQSKNNLIEFRNILENENIFNIPKENITNSFDEDTTEILEKTRTICRKKDTETIFIYYIGHGVRDFNENPSFYLTGTNSKNDANESLLKTSLLDYKEIKNATRRANAKTVIIILDCCYSGFAHQSINDDFIKDILIDTPIRSNFSKQVFIISSTENETQKIGNEPHTLFSKTLFSALKEGADNGKEYLSFKDVCMTLNINAKSDEGIKPLHSIFNGNEQFNFCKNVQYNSFFIKGENSLVNKNYNEALSFFIKDLKIKNRIDTNYSEKLETITKNLNEEKNNLINVKSNYEKEIQKLKKQKAKSTISDLLKISSLIVIMISLFYVIYYFSNRSVTFIQPKPKEEIITLEKTNLKPKDTTISYTVLKNESVTVISKKFNINIDTLIKINNLEKKCIKYQPIYGSKPHRKKSKTKYKPPIIGKKCIKYDIRLEEGQSLIIPLKNNQIEK